MSSPEALTMDRLDSVEEVIVAQTTSQCCRCCCWQPSINWVISEQDHFEAGTNPFDLPSNGWIHEESSFCGRMWSWILPGCRSAKYVQHSNSEIPPAIRGENQNCTCQTTLTTQGLSQADRQSDVIATHEKDCTCGYCFQFGDITFPICNCFPLPYLETKVGGQVVGRTVYICDAFVCIPKFDVLDVSGQKKFHIRSDTCFGGCCVQCRCDAKKKCLRVPFYVRDPNTLEKLNSFKVGDDVDHSAAKIDSLWSGWANECCYKKDAYHVVYPANMTAEDKLLLTGSAILVDLTVFEQRQDDN
jgi:hypothetical protein